MDELLRLVREDRLSVLIATHNPAIARRMDRALTLRGGRLEAVAPPG
jgi:lipoprotein-releasing system ATP-binding protein